MQNFADVADMNKIKLYFKYHLKLGSIVKDSCPLFVLHLHHAVDLQRELSIAGNQKQSYSCTNVSTVLSSKH